MSRDADPPAGPSRDGQPGRSTTRREFRERAGGAVVRLSRGGSLKIPDAMVAGWRGGVLFG